jgi:hypothetical protein
MRKWSQGRQKVNSADLMSAYSSLTTHHTIPIPTQPWFLSLVPYTACQFFLARLLFFPEDGRLLDPPTSDKLQTHIPHDHGLQAIKHFTQCYTVYWQFNVKGTAQNWLMLSFVSETITVGGPINKIFQTSKFNIHCSRGYVNNRLLVVIKFWFHSVC